jgi:putative nucleotidyltransferase with HDIG domain
MPRPTRAERRSRVVTLRHSTPLTQRRTLGRRLRALALDDPSAGRHAAAVAHNALTLARRAGLRERDQEIAHTAGLLHDIGKPLPLNANPVAERELRRNDHRLIRRPRVDGARLVREVPGLECVAAVLSPHERLDGNGYPFGLRGRSIPAAARVVAVAEVYDVLTSPD